MNFNIKCCFASSLVFSQMPVPGTFHGVMPRLFLKGAEMFCRRTAAIYIKTICYHGDIHPSSFEIFLEQNVFVHIHTESRTKHNHTVYYSTVWIILIFFLSVFKFRNLSCEHKKVKSCTVTYQGLFKVTWSTTIQWESIWKA